MDMNLPPSLLYLWDKRTLFIGGLDKPIQITHASSTFFISFDLPMTVRLLNGEERSCHSVLLPADQTAFIDAGGSTIASCNLDVFGRDYAALKRIMSYSKGGAYFDIQSRERYVQAFSDIWHRQSCLDETFDILGGLIVPVDLRKGIRSPVDMRVVKVVKIIKETIGDNVSVDFLAQQVNLSTARLVQLFKQQTSVPIRRFRVWYRLYVTAVLMAGGISMTEAAIRAGFSDSSHFSHAFKAMLGMRPSQVFSHSNLIQVRGEALQ